MTKHERFEIGTHIRGMVAEALRGNGITESTRKYLAPCLDPLENAVELLCPIGLVPSKRGLHSIYGPACNLKERTTIFVTPQHSMIGAINEWWEPSDQSKLGEFTASLPLVVTPLELSGAAFAMR
jgi:hypothetical protein